MPLFLGSDEVQVNIDGKAYQVEYLVINKSYTLTLTNIGNTYLYYWVDDIDDFVTAPKTLNDGETVVLTDIREGIRIETYIEFIEEESTFRNCTAEWSSDRKCIIYPTGANAVANVYAYD